MLSAVLDGVYNQRIHICVDREETINAFTSAVHMCLRVCKTYEHAHMDVFVPNMILQIKQDDGTSAGLLSSWLIVDKQEF